MRCIPLCPDIKRSASRRKEHGFTLVELMVAMVIGLFLIGGVISVFISNKQSSDTKQRLDRAQEIFRFGSTTITRVVRLGTAIEPTSTANQLVVKLPGGPGRSDCVGVTSVGTNIFRVNENNQLICIDVVGTDNVLVSGVSSLVLAYGEDVNDDGVLENSEFVEAPEDWANVVSTRITLTLPQGQNASFVATMRPRTMQTYGAANGTGGSGGGSNGPDPSPGPDPEDPSGPDTPPDPDPEPDPDPDPGTGTDPSTPEHLSMCTCSRSGNSDNYAASGGAGCNQACCRVAASSNCGGKGCTFTFQTNLYCSIP